MARKINRPATFSTFVTQYLETALWSSCQCDENGNGGRPFDDDFGIDDIADASVAGAIADCHDFQDANAEDLANAGDDSQNGHDFWLTRNHHGAGFWDRGYEAGVSKRLTDASHAYGGCDLFVGSDGKVYFS